MKFLLTQVDKQKVAVTLFVECKILQFIQNILSKKTDIANYYYFQVDITLRVRTIQFR